MPVRRVVRRCFRRICAFAAFGLAAFAAPCWTQVLVVLSDDAASYREVAAEMQAGLKSLREGRLRVDVVGVDRMAAIAEPALNAYELVVTVGLSAAQAAF